MRARGPPQLVPCVGPLATADHARGGLRGRGRREGLRGGPRGCSGAGDACARGRVAASVEANVRAVGKNVVKRRGSRTKARVCSPRRRRGSKSRERRTPLRAGDETRALRGGRRGGRTPLGAETGKARHSGANAPLNAETRERKYAPLRAETRIVRGAESKPVWSAKAAPQYRAHKLCSYFRPRLTLPKTRACGPFIRLVQTAWLLPSMLSAPCR